MPNLTDLPPELLVDILVQVDDADPHWLAQLALTCKALCAIVNNPDESLWRAVHCKQYDNPLDACAFLQPRADIRWRQRVVDRAFTLPFLKEHSARLDKLCREYYASRAFDAGGGPWRFAPDVWETNDRMFAHTPRVLFAVLDLFLDLPSQEPANEATNTIPDAEAGDESGQDVKSTCSKAPSKNATIIEEIANMTAFKYILREGPGYIDPDRKDVERHQGGRSYWEAAAHLETVLANLNGFAAHIEQSYQILPPMRPEPSKPWTPPPTEWPTDPTTSWRQMQRDVSAMLGDVSTGFYIDSSLVRSPGVLRLQRPSDTSGVWDWAGVRGPWGAYSTDRTADSWYIDDNTTGYAGWPVRLDGTFELVPVAGRADVQRAFDQKFGGEETADLWSHLAPDNVVTHILPPIYFYSEAHTPLAHPTRGCLRSPHPPMFLYGVVHLTTDSPPEVMWTVVGQVIGDRERSIVMRGIQPGGVKTDLGFFGSWGPRTEFQKAVPRKNKPDELGFGALGSAWFYKLDAPRPPVTSMYH